MPSDLTQAQLQQWLRAWQHVGPELDAERAANLVGVDTALAVAQLAPAIADAVARFPPKQNSGMVEMQRYFALLRQAQPPATDFAPDPCCCADRRLP